MELLLESQWNCVEFCFAKALPAKREGCGPGILVWSSVRAPLLPGNNWRDQTRRPCKNRS